MPREKIFWLLLGSILIVGLGVSVARDRTRVVEHSFLEKRRPSPQNKERTWGRIRLVQEQILGVQTAMRLINPLMASATPEGRLFVLDWGDRAIKEFDRDGTLLRIYRTWNERSPGEALVPSHFAVSRIGEVWVCYQEAHLIKVFSEGGESLRSFQVKRLPHRVAPLPGGEFVVMGGEPSADIFQRYDRTGRLVASFGRILEGEVQHPLVLDGWITGAGSVIYASRYSGLLASYLPAGDLVYLVRTIDPSPLPRIWINSDGRWKVEPGSPLKSLGVSIADGKVYVLSERESKVAGNRILDIYSEARGAYLYSIRLPQHARHFDVVGGTLYTVGKDRVIRWKIEERFAQRE